MGAGLDELGADLESVDEAGAGGGEIEAPGTGGPDFFLHEAGGRGEEHIRRDGGDDDGFDFGGFDAALAEEIAGGFGGEVAGGYPFVDDVTLADAGAVGDPFVVGGDHLFEIGVSEKAWRNVGPYSGNFGADSVPLFQRQTQTTTPREIDNREHLIAVSGEMRFERRDAEMRETDCTGSRCSILGFGYRDLCRLGRQIAILRSKGMDFVRDEGFGERLCWMRQ